MSDVTETSTVSVTSSKPNAPGNWTDSPIKCGVHISITGTIDQAVDRAQEKTCNTFQIFTRNPRSWKTKRLEPKNIIRFKEKVSTSGIFPVVAHMPYLANLSSPRETVYKKSIGALLEELNRCGKLGIPFIVTHLGSHLGIGREMGLNRLINALNLAIESSESKATILIENTAGTKNSMGSSFEDIREIIDNVVKSHVGICFDTCHAFAAGYDLRNKDSVEGTMSMLRDTVDLALLKVVHINDSKGDLASRIDRHEHIGLGCIGHEGFRAILHDRTIRELPLILETPIDRRGTDITNIQRIRRLAA
ncbi:MAG: deoxyribonuclease IV [Candidatus Bathyarchaeota archaeon]|jgi:deoxyribonuclease-4|nr:deoxyribonuclease IV [Candidatus Bathyarchaeota archaeon]